MAVKINGQRLLNEQEIKQLIKDSGGTSKEEAEKIVADSEKKLEQEIIDKTNIEEEAGKVITVADFFGYVKK
ncbi:unnamed protein product [Didymodactylos carnosus]|uniref:Uncharacterized protein n=1 Tax=Didymodactylos carnosus TaxID=1234261 RepID=A0A8S2DG35_9BILA|nr:unnamed protein product [Didymodactylos carnosus]CAF3670401.1 unnamed protein product [Didymodactylos carnosus]